MERLTDKRLAIPPGQWQEVTREEAREMKEIPVPPMRDLYYRLSQIEDILCDGTDEYDLDRLAVLCNQRMTMRDEVSQRFGLTAKIPLDRLRELAEADREGRCMIVPVKSGQSVYCLQDYFNETTLKSEKRVKCRTVDFVLAGAKMFETEGFIWRFSEIGEKIFLTREEAEAALAKEST